MREYCAICGTGKTGTHRECLDAYALDYDPASREDARQWLDARRRQIAENMNTAAAVLRECAVEVAAVEVEEVKG